MASYQPCESVTCSSYGTISDQLPSILSPHSSSSNPDKTTQIPIDSASNLNSSTSNLDDSAFELHDSDSNLHASTSSPPRKKSRRNPQKKPKNQSEKALERKKAHAKKRTLKSLQKRVVTVDADVDVVELPVSEGGRQGARSLELVTLAVRKQRKPEAIRQLLGYITPVLQPIFE